MRNGNIWQSFRAAGAGVYLAWREGRNMRFHVLAGYTVLLLGYWLRLAAVEYALLMFVIALVAGTELVNTAIEAAVDLNTNRYHPLAKKAKDIAAGAVLFSAVAAAGAGWVLLYPRLPELADMLARRLARPDAGTLVGLGGFALLLASWLVTFRWRPGAGGGPGARAGGGPVGRGTAGV